MKFILVSFFIILSLFPQLCEAGVVRYVNGDSGVNINDGWFGTTLESAWYSPSYAIATMTGADTNSPDTLYISGTVSDSPYLDSIAQNEKAISWVGINDTPIFSASALQNIGFSTRGNCGYGTPLVFENIRFSSGNSPTGTVFQLANTDGILRDIVFENIRSQEVFVALPYLAGHAQAISLYNCVFDSFTTVGASQYMSAMVTQVGNATGCSVTVTADHVTFRNLTRCIGTYDAATDINATSKFIMSNCIFDSVAMYSSTGAGAETQLYLTNCDTYNSYFNPFVGIVEVTYTGTMYDVDPLFVYPTDDRYEWMVYLDEGSPIKTAATDGLPIGVTWGYTSTAASGGSSSVGRSMTMAEWLMLIGVGF